MLNSKSCFPCDVYWSRLLEKGSEGFEREGEKGICLIAIDKIMQILNVFPSVAK
jgi:hypothetical protein